MFVLIGGEKKVLSAFKIIVWVLKRGGKKMEKWKIHVNFLFLKRLCPVSMYSCVLYILLCSLLPGSKPACVVSVVQGGVLFSKDNGFILKKVKYCLRRTKKFYTDFFFNFFFFSKKPTAIGSIGF